MKDVRGVEGVKEEADEGSGLKCVESEVGSGLEVGTWGVAVTCLVVEDGVAGDVEAVDTCRHGQVGEREAIQRWGCAR